MTRYHGTLGDKLKMGWNALVQNRQINRGAAWGMMIVGFRDDGAVTVIVSAIGWSAGRGRPRPPKGQ